jgi:hypothetical protein
VHGLGGARHGGRARRNWRWGLRGHKGRGAKNAGEDQVSQESLDLGENFKMR